MVFLMISRGKLVDRWLWLPYWDEINFGHVCMLYNMFTISSLIRYTILAQVEYNLILSIHIIRVKLEKKNKKINKNKKKLYSL